METKEIKIKIPEGYKIDEENSTFECIKFKPNEKYITYDEISKRLFKGYITSHINSSGEVEVSNTDDTYNYPNIAPFGMQLIKLLALNQLINIAYYYNCSEYVDSGYYIYYLKERDEYCTGRFINGNIRQTAEITVMFKNEKDAQAVIDNPNFRDILDILCK